MWSRWRTRDKEKVAEYIYINACSPFLLHASTACLQLLNFTHYTYNILHNLLYIVNIFSQSLTSMWIVSHKWFIKFKFAKLLHIIYSSIMVYTYGSIALNLDVKSITFIPSCSDNTKLLWKWNLLFCSALSINCLKKTLTFAGLLNYILKVYLCLVIMLVTSFRSQATHLEVTTTLYNFHFPELHSSREIRKTNLLIRSEKNLILEQPSLATG